MLGYIIYIYIYKVEIRSEHFDWPVCVSISWMKCKLCVVSHWLYSGRAGSDLSDEQIGFDQICRGIL